MQMKRLTDEDISRIFEHYAIDTADGRRIAPPEGFAQMMKSAGFTPYYFLRRAIIELTVKDNHIAAEGYVRYAAEFCDKFFENETQESDYQTLLRTVELFIDFWCQRDRMKGVIN